MRVIKKKKKTPTPREGDPDSERGAPTEAPASDPHMEPNSLTDKS